MKILLDTQIFLWYITNDKRLTKKRLEQIAAPANEIFISAASIWECCIKQNIRKLNFPDEAAKYLKEQRQRHQFQALSIDENCLKHLSLLPDIHNDPFDRILISQAMELHLQLMTDDFLIKKYSSLNLKFL